MLFEQLQFCQSSMCNVNIKIFLEELPNNQKIEFISLSFLEEFLDKLKHFWRS